MSIFLNKRLKNYPIIFKNKRMINRLFGPRIGTILPPTYTLVYDSVAGGSGGGSVIIGNTNDSYYFGNVLIESGSHTITQLACELTYGLGDLTGKIFTMSLYSTVAGTLLCTGSITATSAANLWNKTVVYFIMSSPYTTTNGVTYYATITMNGVDASNYANSYFTSPSVSCPIPWPGNGFGTWRSDGSASAGFGFQYQGDLRLYTSP